MKPSLPKVNQFLRSTKSQIAQFQLRGMRSADIRLKHMKNGLLRLFFRLRVEVQKGRLEKIVSSHCQKTSGTDEVFAELRREIRRMAGLDPDTIPASDYSDIVREFLFLSANAGVISRIFRKIRGKRVLYVGQCYYNSYYISRSLRKIGWKADLLDWDLNSQSKKFYHGSDFEFQPGEPYDYARDLNFFMKSIYGYDIFHFANAHGISFGASNSWFNENFGKNSEIFLLKALGKSIVYTNNGCNDGVTQSSFATWGPSSPCDECVWQGHDQVCGDFRNADWGKFRNDVADYQCLLGGNRIDFNISPKIHEEPEYYCLSPDIWNPALVIPEKYRLRKRRSGEIRVYHAVGNKKLRTRKDGATIKSTHIYLPLLEKMVARGHDIELISPDEMPNLDVRYLQLQSDIFLEMLTFGWFGANAREAMMLGKPVICFIRPEWLASLREEIPDYADELPIISATPQTVEKILEELIDDSMKREEIGRRSRDFALKWHSDTAGAKRFDAVYSRLLWPNGEQSIARPKL